MRDGLIDCRVCVETHTGLITCVLLPLSAHFIDRFPESNCIGRNSHSMAAQVCHRAFDRYRQDARDLRTLSDTPQHSNSPELVLAVSSG
jgi:hypothetical protein